MKPKAAIKIVVDVFMTLALLLLMGYQFLGDAAHEWIGGGMLVLFIAHHILNAGWYKTLFKGKYTPMRVFQFCVDTLVLIAMLAQMYSGITMSRHVFAFLPFDGGMAPARRLHILGAYWGFVLMSLHLGMHWSMFIGLAKKHLKNPSRVISVSTALAGVLIAAYGIFVFVRRDLLTYLLLQTEFVFMDFSESKLLFYLDYLAMMGLFIFLAHSCSKILRKFGAKHKKEMPFTGRQCILDKTE